MSGPVELRQYLRKYTLDDARSGLNSIRLPVGPVVNGQQATDLFIGPVLEYRYKERVQINGGPPTTDWSPWIQCPIVKEGDPGEEK